MFRSQLSIAVLKERHKLLPDSGLRLSIASQAGGLEKDNRLPALNYRHDGSVRKRG
jgi:hypothetical protein